MLTKLKSIALIGIQGYQVEVQVDVTNNLPKWEICLQLMQCPEPGGGVVRCIFQCEKRCIIKRHSVKPGLCALQGIVQMLLI